MLIAIKTINVSKKQIHVLETQYLHVKKNMVYLKTLKKYVFVTLINTV